MKRLLAVVLGVLTAAGLVCAIKDKLEKRRIKRAERLKERREREKLYAVVRRAHESGEGDTAQRFREAER